MDTYHIDHVDCTIIRTNKTRIWHIFYKNKKTLSRTIFGNPSKVVKQYISECGDPELLYVNRFGIVWTWKKQEE